MGNFEKLSVVVIVVIIVMILVVALHTWTDRPDASHESGTSSSLELVDDPGRGGEPFPPGPPGPLPLPLPGPSDDWTQDPTPGPTPVVDPPAETGAPVLTDYVVQAGDFLGKISQEHYGSPRYIQQILDANPGNGEYLREGQTLKLPSKEWVLKNDRSGSTPPVDSGDTIKPGTTYTTRKGDTWERISLRTFKTKDRWPMIYALNSSVHDSAYSELPAGLTINLPQ